MERLTHWCSNKRRIFFPWDLFFAIEGGRFIPLLRTFSPLPEEPFSNANPRRPSGRRVGRLTSERGKTGDDGDVFLPPVVGVGSTPVACKRVRRAERHLSRDRQSAWLSLVDFSRSQVALGNEREQRQEGIPRSVARKGKNSGYAALASAAPGVLQARKRVTSPQPQTSSKSQ
jgi:hypothetical protein